MVVRQVHNDAYIVWPEDRPTGREGEGNSQRAGDGVATSGGGAVEIDDLEDRGLTTY